MYCFCITRGRDFFSVRVDKFAASWFQMGETKLKMALSVCNGTDDTNRWVDKLNKVVNRCSIVHYVHETFYLKDFIEKWKNYAIAGKIFSCGETCNCDSKWALWPEANKDTSIDRCSAVSSKNFPNGFKDNSFVLQQVHLSMFMKSVWNQTKYSNLKFLYWVISLLHIRLEIKEDQSLISSKILGVQHNTQ